MGREIRKVAANWSHPKKKKFNIRTGKTEEHYQPMFAGGFDEALAEWLKDWEAWKAGGYVEACKDHPEYVGMGMPAAIADWQNGPPDPAYYAPDWTDAERTHFQLYETVSEGTPLSPPMPSVEELARWLADNHKPWGADRGNRTYEEWLAFCQQGWAPSFVVSDGVPMDGVEYVAKNPA